MLLLLIVAGRGDNLITIGDNEDHADGIVDSKVMMMVLMMVKTNLRYNHSLFSPELCSVNYQVLCCILLLSQMMLEIVR